jgi:hypothetical protein
LKSKELRNTGLEHHLKLKKAVCTTLIKLTNFNRICNFNLVHTQHFKRKCQIQAASDTVSQGLKLYLDKICELNTFRSFLTPFRASCIFETAGTLSITSSRVIVFYTAKKEHNYMYEILQCFKFTFICSRKL